MGELSNITNLTSEKLLSFSASEEPATSSVASARPAAVLPDSTDGYDDIDPGELPDDYDDFHGYSDLPVSRAPLSHLARKALQILLVQPEVSAHMQADAIGLIREDPSAALLSEVLALVHERDIRSPVLLLAHYKGSDEFGELCELAEKEQLLSPQDLEDEFIGTIKHLMESRQKDSKAELRARLLAKPFTELTAEEKDQLRTLSR
jgi:hypothetical protein